MTKPMRSKEAISMTEFSISASRTDTSPAPDEPAPAKGLTYNQQQNLEKLLKLRYQDHWRAIQPTVNAWRDARYAEIDDTYASVEKKIKSATFKNRVAAAEKRIQAEITKLRTYLKEVGVESGDPSYYGPRFEIAVPYSWTPANKAGARQKVAFKADALRRQMEARLETDRKAAERAILLASLGAENVDNILGLLPIPIVVLDALLAEQEAADAQKAADALPKSPPRKRTAKKAAAVKKAAPGPGPARSRRTR